jgi:hypothetical protein
MNPPKLPPVTNRSAPSTASRSQTASTPASTSREVTSPQSRLMAVANASPYPVEPRGFDRKTAYPRAARVWNSCHIDPAADHM